MSLQRQQDGYSRLKRVCLIGDHNQLPPVVKNMAFQKYSHLDQSLFARFVRLGMPYVQLNAQVCLRAWTKCRQTYASALTQSVQSGANVSVGTSSIFGWPLHQLFTTAASFLPSIAVQKGMPQRQVKDKVMFCAAHLFIRGRTAA